MQDRVHLLARERDSGEGETLMILGALDTDASPPPALPLGSATVLPLPGNHLLLPLPSNPTSSWFHPLSPLPTPPSLPSDEG